MFARISAFVIWSLVAATAVFWLLRLTTSTPQAPAYAVAVGKSTIVRGDLARLFGAPPTVVAAVESVPEAPSRFKLVGVMAPRAKEAQSIAGRGLALIAVDGKPAKAFSVGAPLDSGLVLQSVGMRTATIGPAQGARSMLLELPALTPPNTGVLPQTGYSGSPVPAGGVGGSQPGVTGMAVPQATNPAMRAPQSGVPVLPPGETIQPQPMQMSVPRPPGTVPSPSEGARPSQ